MNPDRLALAYHIPRREHMYVMSFLKKKFKKKRNLLTSICKEHNIILNIGPRMAAKEERYRATTQAATTDATAQTETQTYTEVGTSTNSPPTRSYAEAATSTTTPPPGTAPSPNAKRIFPQVHSDRITLINTPPPQPHLRRRHQHHPQGIQGPSPYTAPLRSTMRDRCANV